MFRVQVRILKGLQGVSKPLNNAQIRDSLYAALVEWLGHHPFKVGDYWFESNMQYYAELE